VDAKFWKDYVRTYSNEHLDSVLDAINEVYDQLGEDWKTWIYKIHLKEKKRRASKQRLHP